MAKRCLVETCKREAETFCYHCSRDVCTKHYLDHKKSIQDQIHPLVDEINFLYDRYRHDDKNQTVSALQSSIPAYSQLEKWRVDCHQRIETIYNRVHDQITAIVDIRKRERAQKAVNYLETLEKLRLQFKELLKDGDITYRQLEKLKHQLEDLKKNEQDSLNCSDIHVVTQKFDFDKYLSVSSDNQNSNPKQQQSKPPQAQSLNKSISFNQSTTQFYSNWKNVDKCPICAMIFPSSLDLVERTIHMNEHNPD